MRHDGSRDGIACVLLALLAGVGIPVAVAQTEAMPSVLAGAYSEEQAIRGQTLYYANCIACHGETLDGLDQASPLVGPQFSGIWDGESLWALVDRIGTMPPDKPGTLSRGENVDLLAYILWYNGLPIGEVPLAADQSILAKMTFETPLPGR